MSAVLNTNTASLWAAKNLLGAQNRLAASVERLSSGLRINRARDDAAGLGVANSLTAQINGATRASVTSTTRSRWFRRRKVRLLLRRIWVKEY